MKQIVELHTPVTNRVEFGIGNRHRDEIVLVPGFAVAIEKPLNDVSDLGPYVFATSGSYQESALDDACQEGIV